MKIPTPQDVAGMTKKSEWSEKIIDSISKKLTNPEYVKQATRNVPFNGFSFTEDGEPTIGDREYICKVLNEQGWVVTSFKTEDHRNEMYTTIVIHAKAFGLQSK